MEEAGSVEEEGTAREGSVSGGARPDVWQHDKEGEHREQEPTRGRPREKAGERGSGGGDEDRKEKGMMKPAERLRIHHAKLDEQAQREVQQEQYRGSVEGQSSESH